MPRALVILLGTAATVIIVAGVQAVAWLIGPAFMALTVVIAIAPVQGWLRRHGWPAWATTVDRHPGGRGAARARQGRRQGRGSVALLRDWTISAPGARRAP
jgi:hypothetical protein